jgi:hypothetical protein
VTFKFRASLPQLVVRLSLLRRHLGADNFIQIPDPDPFKLTHHDVDSLPSKDHD